jgi:MoxR-like ATPase
MSAKSATTKIETLTLKPSETAAAIRAMQRTRKRALFLWGGPGISKSDVSMQVATGENMAFIDLRLSQMEPTDLRGIPRPAMVDGVEGVVWTPPYVLPKDLDLSLLATIDTPEPITVRFANPIGKNDIHYVTDIKMEVYGVGTNATAEILERGLDYASIALRDASGALATGKIRFKVKGKARAIIGLEEFNSAPQSVQAAAYQFVLDRRLGEYIVPKGVWIMGMGNRDTDRGVTYKMPTPIMNRFTHIEMRHDFDDWQTWAIHNRVHADVVGYVTAFKEELNNFNPSTASRGFPTPRSWHAVSDILHANADVPLPHSVMMGLLCGSIGEGSGLKFNEFRRVAADLPRADDILSGRLKQMPKKAEVSLAYALTTTLGYELKERADRIRRDGAKSDDAARKQWLVEADNFLEFMMDNFQPEICIMGTKAAIHLKLPFDTRRMKNFKLFATKYKDLIVS